MGRLAASGCVLSDLWKSFFDFHPANPILSFLSSVDYKCDMGALSYRQPPVALWCWHCGREFQAQRLDARTCGSRCRQRVSRIIRDTSDDRLAYIFRGGPKSGRSSKVYEPQNWRRICRGRRKE
jgi:hypothetical protein